MAATQPTIADLEAAQAELEQARDDLTDVLSQYGRHGLAYAEAEKRVEAATRKNDELRRAGAKAASRGFAETMANANSDNPQPDPFLQSLLHWNTQHAPACQVTKERADLLAALENDPTNAGLLGALPEYDNGGDQEAENCDCGAYDAAQAVLAHVRSDDPENDPEVQAAFDLMRAQPRTVAVPVPYEGTQPLEVELGGDNLNTAVRELQDYLDTLDGVVGDDDDLARVFAGAVVLHTSGAGSFAECLHTALVWECG
jgi:hypothetical protein